MIMMPYCKRRPKNYDECDLEGRVSCTLKEHFKLNVIGCFYQFIRSVKYLHVEEFKKQNKNYM